MMNEKLSKLERSWILYDVGNSAFVLLVSTIMPIYFKYLAGNEWIGISFQTAMLLAFIITAVWWLILSVPLIVHYKQIHAITETKNSITSSFSQLGNTFSDMIKHRQILFFLVAFFFYIDGVYTIIDMATAYGEALGLNTTGLLLALLLTQVIAFPCALIFGKLSKRFAPERLISLCIIAYIGISIFAIQLNQQWEFWFLAVCVGMFQGGIQALSRSYFAKIIPAEKSGEYFGILDICGKGASFIGTTLVSLITQITGHSEAGVSIISVIMIIGFILFRITVHQENQYTNSATKISVSNTK